ncbi:MAG: HAD-IIA family hydrolase [Candidatus Lokiarchaeota archaeon]|nr:HAD-IIA family hydrolase [Candidatus Lokiarchaeota archaeon]
MRSFFKDVKAILCDIDGTLYFKGEAIKGAIDTVSYIKELGIKILFFTNTDSKPPQRICRILKDFGFDVKEDEIFSPIIALKEFLAKHPRKKIFLVTTQEVAREFQKYDNVGENETPDFVIIGDFQDDWDVNRLNRAFQHVLQGATLLGTQGNIFYLDRKGNPVIDTGSFVEMIARATSTKAKIFGKPSKEYFEQAIELLDVPRENVVVIGDDYESDIQGAFNVGLRAILVKTGKGKYFNISDGKKSPEMIIPSFNLLKEYL